MSPPFQVRHATLADAPGLLEVWATEHPETLADAIAGVEGELRKAAADAGRLVLVAEHAGQILAYSRARLWLPQEVAPHRHCPDGWWLSGSVVHPRHRRRGVGHALMRSRLRWLAGRTAVVHSKVAADNVASLAWHHAHGFVELTRDFDCPGRSVEVGSLVLLHWTPSSPDTQE